MSTYVFDAEWKVADRADIVLDAQHLWCVVFKELGKDNYQTFTMDTQENDTMKEWLNSHTNITLIGHNIINADLEVFRRLLGVDFTVGPDTICGNSCTFIDTYTMSKRNNPDRSAAYLWDPVKKKNISLGVHGLGAWAKRVGSAKHIVTDWSTQPIEVYLERCKGDVDDNEAAYYMMLEERE